MQFPTDDEISGFYLDDGTKIDPNLLTKPSLCVSCQLNDSTDPEDEVLCTLTRIDQRNEEEFRCDAYKPKQFD
ncbi:hypothetical protein B6D60_04780 [candidate division KSB1 bacterium 4484_87]|nr:MAG: hypothetical protein B6D60_04780 [candidate division KSB1 bacterium 4484_87]